MKITTTALILVLLSLGIHSATFVMPTSAQVDQMVVASAIAPLEGIVKSVGGVFVNSTILLPEGVEPHAASLPTEAVLAAEAADLLILTGHFPWEESLVSVVDTPFISLHAEDALFTYEDHGAHLSPMPGHHEEAAIPSQDDHEHNGENPHGYWLLPSNAVAIANTTLSALKSIDPARQAIWQKGFDQFVAEVEGYTNLVQEMNQKHQFSELKAVVVFPAEAYVAETFGIEAVATLQVEGVLISGVELLEVQQLMQNGSVTLILGSDVAALQTGGEYAYQMAEDYSVTLVWVRAVFFKGLSDYTSVMTYNLGAMVTGISQARGSSSTSAVNLALIVLAGSLGFVAIGEAVVLIRRARSA